MADNRAYMLRSVLVGSKGARAPYWVNNIHNISESACSDFEHTTVWEFDAVPEPSLQGVGPPDQLKHEENCNEMRGIFEHHFSDCEYKRVRMQPGQREGDLRGFVRQGLVDNTPRDLNIVYFDGVAGGEDEAIIWKFRGPGPNEVNGYNIMRMFIESPAATWFILSCNMQTRVPKGLRPKGHLTEFTIAQSRVCHKNGQPRNSEGELTQTLCRSLRNLMKTPPGRGRETFHEIMGRDKDHSSHPLRVWTERARRERPKDHVDRIYVDIKQLKETGSIVVRKGRITGRNHGGFAADDDDEDGDSRHDGGGGGSDNEDSDGPPDEGYGEGNGGGNGDEDNNDDDSNDDSDDNDNDNRITEILGQLGHRMQSNLGQGLSDDPEARKLVKELCQSRTKRKRAPNPGACSRASRRSRRSSSGSGGRMSETSGDTRHTPVALEIENEESLFMPQDPERSEAVRGSKRAKTTATTVFDNLAIDPALLDPALLDPREEDVIVNYGAYASPDPREMNHGNQNNHNGTTLPQFGKSSAARPGPRAANLPQMAEATGWLAPFLPPTRETSAAPSQSSQVIKTESLKRSTSPFFAFGSTLPFSSGSFIKREYSADPEIEIVGSKCIAPFIDLTSDGEDGDVIDLTQDDEPEESMFFFQ